MAISEFTVTKCFCMYILSLFLFYWFVFISRCGSGLSGECLTDQGHYWVGLDISPAMLGKSSVNYCLNIHSQAVTYKYFYSVSVHLQQCTLVHGKFLTDTQYQLQNHHSLFRYNYFKHEYSVYNISLWLIWKQKYVFCMFCIGVFDMSCFCKIFLIGLELQFFVCVRKVSTNSVQFKHSNHKVSIKKFPQTCFSLFHRFECCEKIVKLFMSLGIHYNLVLMWLSFYLFGRCGCREGNRGWSDAWRYGVWYAF